MPRLPWLDRTWSFDYSVDLFPSVLERLRGTPARLEEAVEGLAREALVQRVGDAWSIQENAGHLLRLEALPAARLEDFLAGAATLSAWAGNEADDEARYGDMQIEDILRRFRTARSRLVVRLDELTPEDFARSARHPRLDQPIRLVDMCLFQADHDDHHLARIHELARAAR